MVATYWLGIDCRIGKRCMRLTAAGGEPKPTLVIDCLEYCCGRPTEYVAYFAFLGLRPARSGDGFLSPASGATKKSASSMPSA